MNEKRRRSLRKIILSIDEDIKKLDVIVKEEKTAVRNMEDNFFGTDRYDEMSSDFNRLELAYEEISGGILEIRDLIDFKRNKVNKGG